MQAPRRQGSVHSTTRWQKLPGAKSTRGARTSSKVSAFVPASRAASRSRSGGRGCRCCAATAMTARGQRRRSLTVRRRQRLQLFKQAVPALSRVALLWNPDNASNRLTAEEIRAAAATLSMTFLRSIQLSSPAPRRADHPLLAPSTTVRSSAPAVTAKFSDAQWRCGSQRRLLNGWFCCHHCQPDPGGCTMMLSTTARTPGVSSAARRAAFFSSAEWTSPHRSTLPS